MYLESLIRACLQEDGEESKLPVLFGENWCVEVCIVFNSVLSLYLSPRLSHYLGGQCAGSGSLILLSRATQGRMPSDV